MTPARHIATPPLSQTGNPGASKAQQRQLIPVSAPVTLRVADAREVRLCLTYADALAETVRRSGRQVKAICIDTGISKSHMSRILSGERALPPDRIQVFFEACGNLYALQWLALRFDRDLTPHTLTVEEKAALFDQMNPSER